MNTDMSSISFIYTFYDKSDEVKMSPICFPFPFISFLDLWLNLTD